MIKRTFLVMVLAIATLLGVVGPATAATTPVAAASSSTAASGQQSTLTKKQQKQQDRQLASIKKAHETGDLSVIKDGPILSAEEVLALGRDLATSVEEQTEVDETTLPAPGREGEVSANASVGLGWYIYFRLSPQDQQFIIAVGAAAVTLVICLVSGGTACAVAGFIATVFVSWVAIYYNPRCWIQITTTYSGRFVYANRYYRC